MKRDYLLRSSVNAKLSLGPSKIQGRGVFARGKIAKGEILMEFGGEAISRVTGAAVRDNRDRSKPL
jgi:SET domain-containing protein